MSKERAENQFDPSIHFDKTPTCDRQTHTHGHVKLESRGLVAMKETSGDAACGADWVPLMEDNRLTTIERSILGT